MNDLQICSHDELNISAEHVFDYQNTKFLTTASLLACLHNSTHTVLNTD